jgi:NAD(P)-dependent dehydrogenase (short-subunit alcohol dehydrogenase family)
MTTPQTSDDRGLAGQTIFVTGAGSGIGRACALGLAKAGANLALFDLKGDGIAEIAETARGLGLNASCHTGDVTSSADVGAAFAAAAAQHGAIHGGINNAGVLGEYADLADCSESDWRRVIDVNVLGVVNAMQVELRQMLKQGVGSIVNIASAAGIIGWAGHSAYVASKHAVVGLTRCVALEAAATGVTVNAICPGFVQTDMVETLKKGYASIAGADGDKAVKAALGRVPIGRVLDPNEIASLAIRTVEHGEWSGDALGTDSLLARGA